jgi:sensor histidine kinase regulating citrate/malate metabolism
VADGKQLEFIDPVDLYTILGNAIDNAIEAVRKLEEPDHRVVSVTIYAKQHMSVLQIENYYEGELHFAGGLPVSSKQDHRYHGFGVKSIRSTVEKYGGSISIDTENHIFLLCILLPTP